MTLIQFFDRLLTKVESHPGLDIDLGSFYATNTVRIQLRNRLQTLRSYATMSPAVQLHAHETIRRDWLWVVKNTRGTGFFDEFKGNEALREELQSFIGKS